MAKKPTHKLIFGEVAPCGVDYADISKIRISRGVYRAVARQASRAYHWANVTCKRCLKARKK
jgi:hypothetical protein